MSTPNDPYGQDRPQHDPYPPAPEPAAGYGAGGYGAGGYGGQPGSYPGSYPAPDQGGRPPSNGAGIAAVVLGVLALLLAWIPLVNLVSIVLAIIGIVLGIVGLRKARRGQATNRGLSLTGVVLSAFALLVAVVVSVLIGVFIGSNMDVLQRCADPGLTQEERQACVQEQVGR